MSSPRTEMQGFVQLLAALSITIVAAGCTDYLERRDALSLGAGDAVAANRAIHTIDPWPADAARTDIEVSGRRVVDAIERYNAPHPAAAMTPSIAIMPAPGLMPPPASP
jgi:hypothetical protein